MEISNSLNNILPVLAMKENVKSKDIRDVVKQLLLIDVGTKLVPFLIGRAVNGVGNIVMHRRNRKAIINESDSRPKTSSIQIHRLYDKSSDNDTYDALIWRLCHLPQTKFLKLAANGIYVIANNDIIHVEDDIYVRQLTIAFDEKNNITESTIEIFSYQCDLIALKDYIADMIHKFYIHRNNQLGQTIYYFDEIPLSLPRLIDGTINYDMAPKNMTFTMAKLSTNKSLDNIYGRAMDMVRRRVRFFMTNKKWYQEKGIPYTLGILLYGEPGCGKTSLIKALSKDCQRHIFNIKLSESTTLSQINNLFFNEKVHVTTDGINSSYNIPIDKRIIVLEDIDCLSDIVLERKMSNQKMTSFEEVKQAFETGNTAPQYKFLTSQVSHLPPTPNAFNYDMISGSSIVDNWSSNIKTDTQQKQQLPPTQHAQKLTLSYLLNVLDGVLETPGRIIIMTSNYPEKLDKALVRPGRIDLKVHFEKCSREDIQEMIGKITGKGVELSELTCIEDYLWTPAEVTQKIFEHINDDMETIISSLNKKKEKN